MLIALVPIVAYVYSSGYRKPGYRQGDGADHNKLAEREVKTTAGEGWFL